MPGFVGVARRRCSLAPGFGESAPGFVFAGFSSSWCLLVCRCCSSALLVGAARQRLGLVDRRLGSCSCLLGSPMLVFAGFSSGALVFGQIDFTGVVFNTKKTTPVESFSLC
nr:hypothetical protein CFP56_48666 [Quercus suber]